MAAEIEFIPEVIEKMAKGASEERTQCPVCGGEKDPRSWICPACFEEHGYGLTLKVRQAVEWAAKRVDNDTWRKLLKLSRLIFSSSDKPEEAGDKELAEDLLVREEFREGFPGVSKEAILSAFAVTRKKIEEEAKEAALRQEREERWQTALTAVRNEFSDDESVDPEVFLDNPIRFGDNGNFITESMMKAACREVSREREAARQSAINAAFLNGIFKKKKF